MYITTPRPHLRRVGELRGREEGVREQSVKDQQRLYHHTQTTPEEEIGE